MAWVIKKIKKEDCCNDKINPVEEDEHVKLPKIYIRQTQLQNSWCPMVALRKHSLKPLARRM
jgi:hypothetical protein